MNPFKKMAETKRPVANKSASMEGKVKTPRIKKHASKADERLYDQNGKFNPQRYNNGKTAGSNRRMFNDAGEINANDRKEALTQSWHLMNNVHREVKANGIESHPAYQPTPLEQQGLSKEARFEILASAMQDPSGEGFRIVGEEIALPIKAILDYEGFARKIFRVKKLAQGELFRVPKDVRSVAYILGGDGQTPEARIKTKWITPPENKITSFPTIDIQDLLHMNFDVLDRAQDTARQEIELQEDKLGINLVDTASQAVNTVTTYATLGVSAFEDVRYQVERHRLVVERFLINRAEMSDIIKTMSTAVDPVTERELLLAGYIGNFMGADILTAAGIGVEEVIPAGTFYACTGPDYLGVMGERLPLQSDPFNKYAVKETVKGWAMVEIVGFVIPNSRAVAKGSK
jgi:hypothetical protein